MGGCLSSITAPRAPIVEFSEGGEKEFYSKYVEDRFLGEGEFGKVMLCHDIVTNEARAVKTIHKGMQFKDNTLYTPIKPDILMRECSILRALEGKHYTLQLMAVYESPALIYVVTEYCAGGDLLHWVSTGLPELRTEIVSRIAFQLLEAVAHCHRHNIIHRDIKPENIMFTTTNGDSDLRLIDYGGSIMDEIDHLQAEDKDKNILEHSEFMGSAFYISPEMYQHSYTYKTDIWSVGVTLYVLVAGYPAEQLQPTFNILQRPKRDLKKLPNLPSDLPDSFMDLLTELLNFHHKQRKPAQKLIDTEFVQFHKSPIDNNEIPLEDVLQTAASPDTTEETSRPSMRKTKSVVIKGSVQRHQLYFKFLDFERSVTFLLASMLSTLELTDLQKRLENKVNTDHATEQSVEVTQHPNENVKMIVIQVQKLLDVLEDMQKQKIVHLIQQISNFKSFLTFSYHIELLTQFKNITPNTHPTPRNNLHSSQSTKQFSSVHGTDVWKSFRNLSANKGVSMRNLSNRGPGRTDVHDLSLPSFRKTAHGNDLSLPSIRKSAHGV